MASTLVGEITDSGGGDRETLGGTECERLFRGPQPQGESKDAFSNLGGGKERAELFRGREIWRREHHLEHPPLDQNRRGYRRDALSISNHDPPATTQQISQILSGEQLPWATPSQPPDCHRPGTAA
jgi:hypothetical protein